MNFQGVLDGQFMYLELSLQKGHLFLIGLFQADPDEMARFAGPFRAFFKAYVADFLAGVVHGGGDDSAHGGTLGDGEEGDSCK
jgi:hypothetical protein